MHRWISDMYYAMFNSYLERLNADCLPPSFKLDQTDGELVLEPLLLFRGDAINLSLQLVCDPLRISQAPSRGFCPSIRWAHLKLQSLVGCHVCRRVSLVFGGSPHYGKFLSVFAFVTG